jgi:putative tricarboxylic transport membrane protein
MYGDAIPAILINRPVLGALLLVTQMVIGFIIWTSFKNRHTEYQT